MILIRHSGDKQMFYGPLGWSLNREQAREFKTPLEAITFVLRQRLEHVELVLRPREGSSEEVFRMDEPANAQTVAA
jgi:hypothetical protein